MKFKIPFNRYLFLKSSRIFFLLLGIAIGYSSNGQNIETKLLTIGDSAPPWCIKIWLKGEPIKSFDKDKIYVLEFWATWCVPCIAAIPRLSDLANKFKTDVVFVGINCSEKKGTPIEKIRAFVDSMGYNMNYNVAVEDSNLMESEWLKSSEEQSIPKAFVVNREGRIAWIGYPYKLDQVIPKIVSNNWNLSDALSKRNLDNYLHQMDDSMSSELYRYSGNYDKGDLGRPDSALFMINEMVRKEPKLKYAPRMTFFTFSSLLKTDPLLAYEYGKEAIMNPNLDESTYDPIIDAIKYFQHGIKIPAIIYKLGANAYEEKIRQFPYPEILDLYNLYDKMAEWFWLGNCKLQSVVAQQKAIEFLKQKNESEMTEFKSKLRKYKK